VLDVGCGRGGALGDLIDTDLTLIGVDTDEDALAKARAEFPTIDFRVQHGEALDFEDASFDVVILSDVIEHIAKPQRPKVVDELHRVLKAGGHLILTAPHTGLLSALDPMDVKRRLPGLYALYARLSGHAPATDAEVGHRHLSVPELRDLLEPRFAIQDLSFAGGPLTSITAWACIVPGRLGVPRPIVQRLEHVHWNIANTPTHRRLGYSVRLTAEKVD